MSTTHLILRLIHIGFGTAVLLLLWIPIATRKGSQTHRRGGRAYLWAGRVVVASALTSCVWGLIDPTSRIGSGDLSRDRDGVVANVLLLYSVLGVLGLVALAEMERGVFVLARTVERSARRWLMAVAALAGASSVALGGWGILVLFSGPFWHGMIRIGVAALGLDIARRTFAATIEAAPTGHRRQIAHLEAMLGSAAAFYVAFTAFGFGRLAGTELLGGGPLAFVPWVAPIMAAWLAGVWWKRRLTPTTEVSPPDVVGQPATES